MNKTGFFEEAPGEKSSTRLKSFILICFLIAFDFVIAMCLKEFVLNEYFIAFNVLVLDYIFRPQRAHKIIENKLFIDELNAKKEDEVKKEE